MLIYPCELKEKVTNKIIIAVLMKIILELLQFFSC
jgi:hypothetical protein